ncbi:hypothetical protein HUJ05_003467 [Dendroctonus ponderosae]|nr:hypothetical protein HUJ05_003467 [Dendroctonus ponderosae]
MVTVVLNNYEATGAASKENSFHREYMPSAQGFVTTRKIQEFAEIDSYMKVRVPLPNSNVVILRLQGDFASIKALLSATNNFIKT